MGILDLFIQKKLVRSEDISSIKKESGPTGEGFEKSLLRRGISAEDILGVKAEYYKIPTRSLGERKVPYEILKYVPEESARYYKFVPLALKDSTLEIGMADPDNLEARDAMAFIASKAGLPFRAYLITDQDFQSVLESYKGLSGAVTEALSELATSEQDVELKSALDEEEDSKKDDNARIIEDAPVTKIVATILHYAVEGTASDIHIEHMGDRIRVRFRVDGVLNTSLVLPNKVHSAVVARIKILCNMRLDEKRKPQDGRFSATIENRKIDFRVSTFPSYFGEKVVMRILDSQKGVIGLDAMGLTERNLKLIREAIDRPYGLILISGPTGSGKSTTLYSMLTEVDKDHENVLSLEDPVEYNVPGMNQSQVRPEIGYTFANGLRSTLRQDPDIIMVGEIRDKETAQLAIQAALTGHLVLSTIHTNSAVGVIPRLVNMGIDPYLIAPTLLLAMAQRLVKALCPGAGKAIPVEDSVRLMFEKEFETLPAEYKKALPEFKEVYEASATSECPNGTRGRVAVIEAYKMTKELEKVILSGATEPEIFKVVRSQGMMTMKEDAIVKALRREVPFEEVNRL
jgi:type IV pilus assembly protein PilB